uniref:Uncharacterized protein n=1 Tax=Rhizophora mucronata TaxID=61149 RepID=A0A2P2PH97_RHIMU
MLFQEKFHLL